jgi:2-polyprenyl-3-methyl-5-hydroxy-6-metoxy-1,4-benzoquinol methylase
MDGSTLAAIKQKQQVTWASGDFAVIGTTLQIVGETLAEAADVKAGERVIDVAAGNGNATLAAARRFARVTSTDYVPHLLEKDRIARAPTAWTSPSRWPTPRRCLSATTLSTSRSRPSA